MTELEKQCFSVARGFALDEERDNRLVGTLGEKPIHRTLKYYIEPDKTKHEVKLCGFVADVLNEQGIFEIQTRAFDRLRKKLDSFLPEHHVTLVFPLIREKRLFWSDPMTGVTSPPRRVSKKGRLSDALSELSKIKKYLGNENLSFRIYVLSADEYRLLDGYGEERKKRATKFTVIPTELLEVLEFGSLGELDALIPAELPERFTAKDFYKVIAMKGRRASFALSLCVELGFIAMVGKLGRAYVYEKAVPKKEW